MAEGTELRKLLIEELSGVDEPAHGFADWLLMKSADDSALDDVLADVAQGFTGLDEGLEATRDYLDAAPEDVRKAHADLSAYVASLSADDDEGVRNRFAGKIRGFLQKGKGDEVAIDKDELITLLAEREESLLKAVDDRLDAAAEEFAKAVEDGDDGDGAGASDDEQGPALADRIETLVKAVDATLDRVANIEEHLTGRQSAADLERSDDAPSAEEAAALRKERGRNAVASALAAAARGERVELR